MRNCKEHAELWRKHIIEITKLLEQIKPDYENRIVFWNKSLMILMLNHLKTVIELNEDYCASFVLKHKLSLFLVMIRDNPPTIETDHMVEMYETLASCDEVIGILDRYEHETYSESVDSTKFSVRIESIDDYKELIYHYIYGIYNLFTLYLSFVHKILKGLSQSGQQDPNQKAYYNIFNDIFATWKTFLLKEKSDIEIKLEYVEIMGENLSL